MKGSEFVKKVKKIAKTQKVTVHFEKGHGKGSHGRFWYGNRFTTIIDLKQDIGPDLLDRMLKQLGLKQSDF